MPAQDIMCMHGWVVRGRWYVCLVYTHMYMSTSMEARGYLSRPVYFSLWLSWELVWYPAKPGSPLPLPPPPALGS